MEMKRLFRDNGLSIVLIGLFLVFLVAHTLTGFAHTNEELQEHQRPELTMGEYLVSGEYVESVAENWESEFLQMFMYVVLSVFLYQKGSAESKDPDGAEEVDRKPDPSRPDAPAPVRQGGWVGTLYGYSLSLAFLGLFLLSWGMHAVGGLDAVNEEALVHGQPPQTLGQYMSSSTFWYESFQNWQSEFLAIGSMVILSIWLRQRGSPESKPVDAAHSETGK
jgi:hypothetical protein